MENICAREKCTGCYACVNVCPKNCISMVENNIGHIYPEIDADQCINCEMCRKTCPVNQPVSLVIPQKAYAAWSLDEQEHRQSTSGGLGTCFARKTIEHGGVVYGCSSSADREVRHIRVETAEDIPLLQGSKYVHSYIKDSYRNIQTDLKEGRTVLFIGTPCQVAGLIGFLKKPYDNLVTVDLVCHGVPPQKLLLEHLDKAIGTDPGRQIAFRTPEGYFLKVLQNNQCIYNKNEYSDTYYLAFDAQLDYRQSCYTCRYATDKRCGDITIGDFWGLGKETPFPEKTENGVSVLLINTQKGKRFVEGLQDELFLCEREVSEAVTGNPQLRRPSGKHKNTDRFEREYREGTNLLQYIRKEQIKYKILSVAKRSPLLMKAIARIEK